MILFLIIIALCIGIIVVTADSSINSPKRADKETNYIGGDIKVNIIVLVILLVLLIMMISDMIPILSILWIITHYFPVFNK